MSGRNPLETTTIDADEGDPMVQSWQLLLAILVCIATLILLALFVILPDTGHFASL